MFLPAHRSQTTPITKKIAVGKKNPDYDSLKDNVQWSDGKEDNWNETQNEDSPLSFTLAYQIVAYLIVRQRFYSFLYLFAYGISFICVFWL